MPTAEQNMLAGVLSLFHIIENVNVDGRCLCETENGNILQFPSEVQILLCGWLL